MFDKRTPGASPLCCPLPTPTPFLGSFRKLFGGQMDGQEGGRVGWQRPELSDGATAAIGIPKLLKRCQWSYDQTGTSVPAAAAASAAAIPFVAHRLGLP